jgi:hypothetical protein
MRRREARRPTSESGQVVALSAMMMVVMIGLVGLSIDVGMLWNDRRHMQTAADAAAIAAATALRNGTDAASAADGVAALNGFTGDSGTSITVNTPPASGPYAGAVDFAEVIISQPEPTYFIRVLGLASMNVSARAVAGNIDGPACVYALDPSRPGAFTTNGNATIQSRCGVIVDSDSATGMTVNGPVTLDATSIGVVGGYSSNGDTSISPAPVTGVAPAPDPLAHVPAPPVGPCTATNLSINGSVTTRLDPGVYCGGITINGTATVTFNPGTYVIDGGGMTVNGNATLSGQGVTFYDTQGYSAYGPIVLNGNAQSNFSAPASGPLAGILFFGDRTIGQGQGTSVITGNSQSTFDGAIYFPTTAVTYNGNSSSSGYTFVIAYDLTFSGDTTITIGNNYSSLAGGSPIKTSALYE